MNQYKAISGFRTISSCLLVILCLFSYNGYTQCKKPHTTVILSLDGFRWDYPLKTHTPTLDKIASEGVKAVSLIPSFPSKTFPNHYTMATGLVPDHNGLVNNTFYDREINKTYAIGNNETRLDPYFYKGEPIWITAMKQGIVTASYFWVGTDVAIQGMHPDYWKPYEQNTPFIQRNDTIIKWLSLPENLSPRLVMAYYHEPDEVGHEFGPNDPRTLKVVGEVDSLTGILYQRIKNLPDGNCINFIVVSDHGMGAITPGRNTVLREYIPQKWPVRIEGGNPNFNFYAEGAWIDSAYLALKKAKNIQVWKASEVPDYLDYGKNPRCGDLVVVADSSCSITYNRPKSPVKGGTHGYDIRNTDIHAIFYAAGPDFKENYIHHSFSNTHIYSLLAKLLDINPALNDGNLDQVIYMLK